MASVSRIMTAKEVADYLRCHISTIYRLAKMRKLPAFRLGADWRFREDAIQSWLNDESRNGDIDLDAMARSGDDRHNESFD